MSLTTAVRPVPDPRQPEKLKLKPFRNRRMGSDPSVETAVDVDANANVTVTPKPVQLQRGRTNSSLSSRMTLKSRKGSMFKREKEVGPAHHHHHHHIHFTTHPMFPPIPIYGPPSLLSRVQYKGLQCLSFFLSLAFLNMVIAGAVVKSTRTGLSNLSLRLRGVNPNKRRKFYKEEQERKKERKEAARKWKKLQKAGESQRLEPRDLEEGGFGDPEFPPLEGGKDKLVCDVRYYARRVGLDVETFKVQTEDGFVITLWHVYNPQEYTPLSEEERGYRHPRVFAAPNSNRQFPTSNRKYPVLLIHGLLQSAGAYCTNDDDSLAFFLCKAGYDVWLGNNRCGMWPEHTTLSSSDPRMWAWNIRHMGVLDLSALISRVLYETGFEKLGLVCHSQGTTQTFVALAKDQRPELSEKISVFCALAPAAYAGQLLEKKHLQFITNLSSRMFTLFFGIHAFIPFMMSMHSIVPPRVFGDLAYLVFSFLFDWSDDRWDRDLRHRMFQFAPVYVSAETMRWWLGCDCFAMHKCILTTREDGQKEEEEDYYFENASQIEKCSLQDEDASNYNQQPPSPSSSTSSSPFFSRKDTAWFGENVPPFALWIAGSDHLVDGRKLLKRFQNGREPNVRLVHAKVIEEYEHLDVLWAMDAVDQVGKEVRDVIWKTMPKSAKDVCRVPRGVEPDS
ncbi:hypothetical protein MPDQ_001661 [Monascus purpureus]|uniref:Partial AB-hydrolase lipase domain-containing protein n=1 Tax=Monascus purpureus TaxID=5098 RepID=A0A507QRE7_MONPU|nr:hypothetical protein MPDQ_001661 [Monascus purpureus]BDD64394.1 hypothetical protein MAP00_009219 [Monascus purpureus]